MPKPVSDLSGEFWNRTEDDSVAEYNELVEMLMGDLLADGYPPFTEPLAPREQYERLEALRVSGSELFYGNDAAMATWERLHGRFG